MRRRFALTHPTSLLVSTMSTVGSQIISELGRRGQRGMYFDYATYRELRKVDSLAALAQFVNTRGVPCPSAPSDVATVADCLQQHATDEAKRDPMTWLLLDPTGCLPILFFPFWLLGQFFRGRQ